MGICDARPFNEARAAIEDRKTEGLAAGMQFTFRNPRRSTDPEATVAGARSLFVGARRYDRQAPAGETGGVSGRVARYSWVDHYGPLRDALGKVADRLRDDGWKAAVVADDNALVDRAAAVRAGLGWYGKNTNVLLPGAGSWFVLGSVVTDAPIAPIEAPAPVEDGCGSCRRCLAACPTGALEPGGRLDARKCLAWLVQAPGPFPREYRAALGDRLYGCDDCQEVCPINRRAAAADPPSPAEAGAQAGVDVVELLASDDAAVLASVGRWYIPGREVRYVRRNAILVLGNTGDPNKPAVRNTLAQVLTDPDPLLRAHGVWAAARLGLLDLLDRVAGDDDPLVTAELDALKVGSR